MYSAPAISEKRNNRQNVYTGNCPHKSEYLMEKTEILLKSLRKRNVQFPCHSRRRYLLASARQSDAKKNRKWTV